MDSRFTNPGDNQWFEKTVTRVVGEELGEEFVEVVNESSYFMDFMRY